MDLGTSLVEFLDTAVIEPVTKQFLGIFDLNGRFGVLFLMISYLVAFGLYAYRKREGTTAAGSYWQFLGGNRVHFHRSALVDYQYYFLRAILKVVCVLPVVAIVDPYILRSGDYVAFFTNLWGARPQLGENMGLMMLYGLGVFLVGDFVHYWVHRAFHSRWLWEFHKVHHSAAVLVPATASRIHFVEKIVEKIALGVMIGFYAGLFYYLCGGEISRYTLFGVTYLVFIFNALAANLRHSHVWLSFGPVIERVINSPAQHQIHHSDAARHFNKNFGTNLSIWDWMFGSLYVTTRQPEPITFGVGDRENRKYQSLGSLVFRPFVVIGQRVWRRTGDWLAAVRSPG
ncbi:sterol desaturase family protein [Marinobacter zhejiangensis]|uniref:Sterol desaturase/sphingolipid hydroxylase, fatty acid hydroxylase superfamily n=1 Tax=Marinobacter zhejiangensis TaxID=488535 RepID=A0A1I4KWW3_9GAMM|nr:sterol desaturase family protein [Marinobacter zhejiangensis]SFL83086.1 Sterol desaturase/sphingolipid hydroxylase, fatty acid hydroxylase superfamily [Marinobacter zhejiangensis]